MCAPSYLCQHFQNIGCNIMNSTKSAYTSFIT
jgi:hypothetical protein